MTVRSYSPLPQAVAELLADAAARGVIVEAVLGAERVLCLGQRRHELYEDALALRGLILDTAHTGIEYYGVVRMDPSLLMPGRYLDWPGPGGRQLHLKVRQATLEEAARAHIARLRGPRVPHLRRREASAIADTLEGLLSLRAPILRVRRPK